MLELIVGCYISGAQGNVLFTRLLRFLWVNWLILLVFSNIFEDITVLRLLLSEIALIGGIQYTYNVTEMDHNYLVKFMIELN